MIFSRLFNKKNWQHKNSANRIHAVENELNADIEEDYQTLLSLLSSDESDLVRRAVLIKLNRFSLWLKASSENNLDKIRAYATKEVEDILLNKKLISLSTNEKLSYIEQHPKTAFLEQWLKQEQQDDIAIALYKKINKASIALSTYRNTHSLVLKRFIVEQESELTALEKLLKKSSENEISALINEKIAKLTAQQEQPKIVAKQAQLILSKLLALKDTTDYEQVVIAQASLAEQWQVIKESFDCLESSMIEAFESKHQHITQQLKQIFQQKAEAYQQQIIIEKLALKKKNAKQAIQDAILALEHQLTESIFNNTLIDEKKFLQETSALKVMISDSPIEQTDKDNSDTFVETLQKKLSKLPDIAQSISDATHLISKVAQIAFPTSIENLSEQEELYKQWLEQWKVVQKKSLGALPDSIVNAHKEVKQQWQSILKPLHNEQEKVFKTLRRKLNDVKRLIDEGKYNAAFGVFKFAEKLHLQCSEKQYKQIDKTFSDVQEKIKQLSDWENYIATPRKQSLVNEVTQLAENPLDNPNEQASKVKEYRKVWNSLGHADKDIDHELNRAFNQACELAFAPCRLFYAEQEALRAKHLTARLSLIEEAKSLTQLVHESSVDWKTVESKFNQINREWREAGEVEKSIYKDIFKQFSTILAPVKNSLNEEHQKNKKAKEQLIQLAEAQLNNDDLSQAIDEVKQLQARWKKIGAAHRKDENILWFAFRQANDKVFAKRSEINDSLKAQEEQLNKHYLAEIIAIDNGITLNTELKANIESYKLAIHSLEKLATELNNQEIELKKVAREINQKKSLYEDEIAKLIKANKKEDWHNLFTVLSDTHVKSYQESPSFESLPENWRLTLENLPPVTIDNENRHHKTIEIEVLGQVDSPSIDKEKRLAIQVKTMQKQLSGEQLLSLEEHFWEWLKIGQIIESDLPFLNRLKVIFT